MTTKKAVFWGEIRKLLAKIIFFVNDKNSWNSEKTALFLNLNFLFLKIQWKLVLATKKSNLFCIWIFYFRKNKIKVSFGCKNSSFSGRKYGKNLWPKPRVHSPFLAMCCTYSPCLIFKQMPRRENFWGKLLRKSHKNQTQKTKILRKMLQKSYFLKQKHFLIFARFS